MQGLVDFAARKRGLATALHFGDKVYEALPAYLERRWGPGLQGLLDAAAEGAATKDVGAGELLHAGLRLALLVGDGDVGQARRMVALLVDGRDLVGSLVSVSDGRRIEPDLDLLLESQGFVARPGPR